MPEVRSRHPKNSFEENKDESPDSESDQKLDFDSEDDKFSEETHPKKFNISIPQGTNKIPHVLETYLKDLPAKWRNYVVRALFSILMMFGSVIGPFGGFFASGFKRAFKVKDFSDIIPGHGGIVDRFDCQFLMATFVNVYITSFIRVASPQKLLQHVYSLKSEQQVEFFYSLKESLQHRGLLGST
uniref:Phosphatidate cytidylyltransferase n=2 Tax=Timema TaxID=61471 RepID=A0A7R9J9E0_TIMCA|nr:unnamed protein product [Timema poppensis]CAD7574390.1 unnamed protein product [Timema californicum]